MKLNDIFKKLAIQSGINETEADNLISSFGNKAFDSIELDETVSNAISAEKFTFDSAINNPRILAKAKAQVLNGVDSELKNLYSEFGLSDDQVAEIEKSESSFKKIGSLTKKVSDLQTEKSKASGKDKDALSTEISKLNGEIKTAKESYEKKISDIENARKQDRVDWTLNSFYNSKEYSLPVDKEIAILTAKNAVDKFMKDKGVVIKPSENGDLVLETTAGSEYFENNVKMSANDFITKRLNEAKLLKLSNTTSNNTNSGPRKLASSVEQPQTGKKVDGLNKLETLIGSFDTEAGF